MSERIYRWIERRGVIPFWVPAIYWYAHWCRENDSRLILTAQQMLFDCRCSVREDFTGYRKVRRRQTHRNP